MIFETWILTFDLLIQDTTETTLQLRNPFLLNKAKIKLSLFMLEENFFMIVMF